MTPQDVQTSHSVVAGTLPIDSVHARVLFDPGATHSFASPFFASRLGKKLEYLDPSLSVSTPVGSVIVDRVIRSCLVLVGEFEYPIDLILLNLLEFDVILGMDWLSSCYASVDCRQKCIVFQYPSL